MQKVGLAWGNSSDSGFKPFCADVAIVAKCEPPLSDVIVTREPPSSAVLGNIVRIVLKASGSGGRDGHNEALI